MPIVTLLVQPQSQQSHVKIESLLEKVLITKPPKGIAYLKMEVSFQQNLTHLSIVLPLLLSEKLYNLGNDVKNVKVRHCEHEGYSFVDCEVIKKGTKQIVIELQLSFLNLLTRTTKGWLLAWHINNLNSLRNSKASFFKKPVPKIKAHELTQILISPKRLEVVAADWSVPLMIVEPNDLREFQGIIGERKRNRISKTGHKWRWIGHNGVDNGGYIPASDTQRCNKIYLRGKYTTAEKLGVGGFILSSATFIKMIIDYVDKNDLVLTVFKWLKDLFHGA